MRYFETIRTFPITGRGHVISTYTDNLDGTERKPPQMGEIVSTIFGPFKVTALENRLGHFRWTGSMLGQFVDEQFS